MKAQTKRSVGSLCLLELLLACLVFLTQSLSLGVESKGRVSVAHRQEGTFIVRDRKGIVKVVGLVAVRRVVRSRDGPVDCGRVGASRNEEGLSEGSTKKKENQTPHEQHFFQLWHAHGCNLRKKRRFSETH